MKRLMIALFICLGCNISPQQSRTDFEAWINSVVVCGWHREYQLCLCGRVGLQSALLTVAPHKTCGR